MAQLVIDSGLQADWSGLLGNPLKIGLSMVSLAFDVVFISQHYFLYGPVEETDDYTATRVVSSSGLRNEREPLLPGARST